MGTRTIRKKPAAKPEPPTAVTLTAEERQALLEVLANVQIVGRHARLIGRIQDKLEFPKVEPES